MKQNQITLANILTYSGTLPLIAAALLTQLPAATASAWIIATAYSAIIISFLCGIHWAIYLFFSEKCPRNLLITSNFVALLAWFSLLVAHQPMALILQMLCFIYLLALDLKLRDAGILPQWFYSLRRNATIIVVFCLSAVKVLS